MSAASPVFGWALFGGVSAGILVASIALVSYYTDRHESERLPFVTTVAALAVTLGTVLLVPVDVYLAPRYHTNVPLHDAVQTLYYFFFLAIAFFFFVAIPFAYFYYEEEDEDVSSSQRTAAACRYTTFMIVIAVVIFVMGAVMSGKTAQNFAAHPEYQKWVDDLGHHDPVRFAIGFATSCLTLLGYLAYTSYTAYGLVHLPASLMRGRRNVHEEALDLHDSLRVTREKKRALTAKYLSGNKMSKKDERTLALLKRQERVLARQGERVEAEAKSCARTCMNVLRPFSFLFGVVSACLSLAYVLNIGFTQFVRLLSSVCGASCGFLLPQTVSPNLLDMLLSATAPYFPLDLIIFAVLMLYVFVATLSGIVSLGIRILWVHLYSIRPRRTPPQGLMLLAMMLMLAFLAVLNQLATLAPNYVSFGHKAADCTLDSQPSCMSVIASLTASVNINFSVFGTIFYFAAFLFLAVTLISAIVVGVRQRRGYEALADDSDEDE